ncbi:MAG: glycosyltransferase family 4 protein [Chloroflexi bacterium]|nr:glycosyltransferase family 4 protein [Chloroflexota bacterium]
MSHPSFKFAPSAQKPIYVDISSAVHSKAGLSRYSANLAHALRPLLGDGLAFFQNSLGHRGPLKGLEEVPTVGVSLGYKPWRAAVWLSQAAKLPMDRLLPGALLLHATEHLLPYLHSVPTVLTVHDLIFEHLPEHHKPANRLYLRSAMPRFCRRADAIIAISECTKRDLIERYAIDEDKIVVIPEAAAPHFGPQPIERVNEINQRYKLPPRYILSVGTIEPRKNLARLLDACEPLFQEDLVDGLVLVGNRGWLYEGFFARLARSPWRERVILAGYVPDEDLPAVYAGAVLCAQPSLYEGFGLPVLEAMACGTPVCAANNSSLPEVGQDAALYFCPTDTEELYTTLRHLLGNDDLRAELGRRGIERAARFSWARTAQETVKVYQRVIESRSCD